MGLEEALILLYLLVDNAYRIVTFGGRVRQRGPDPKRSDVEVLTMEIAQFVYLLLNNSKIRDVINTVGNKGVLLLGRFSADRKKILDRIREKPRGYEYLPIVSRKSIWPTG